MKLSVLLLITVCTQPVFVSYNSVTCQSVIVLLYTSLAVLQSSSCRVVVSEVTLTATVFQLQDTHMQYCSRLVCFLNSSSCGVN